ncbi:LrgB-like family-domain-containing protein [Pseudomassariella vexata]|uniref:LrgB-like family-domain-containing protein n=1 Tax=Pseudomassariella vexata TaxID=1141098 RepID=A0A1Y2DNB1_9PEZI|nr:LrgB-like family-domain-containing protein [Pseudomassariella vexata]ORY60762.1 LrgB-like family-domain-containing protein [Pseudomassariella vexata]
MAIGNGKDDLFGDLISAVKIAVRNSRHHVIQSWFWIPVGILAVLAACFGVNQILRVARITFPASVACLLVLLFTLLLSERFLGEHWTRKFVNLIEIPCGWSLRWINVFFSPSFVLLPLSPPIGAVEVFKIIAVFVVGYLVGMAVTAYMVRGLQVALGTSKRAMTERAEELGAESDDIPMSVTPRGGETPTPLTISAVPSSTNMLLQPPPTSRAPSQASSQARSEELAPEASSEANGVLEHVPSLSSQAPEPSSRSALWAAELTSRLPALIYLSIFLFVGIPIYYVLDYAMPMQLSFAVLTYLGALSIPSNWRQYLHPVLVSALFTAIGLWILALIKGGTLTTALTEYKTGAKYLALWEGDHNLPGAGDIFSSVLDVSIVALALPMFQYRRELRQHFFAIVVPSIVMSIGSLFAYPYISCIIGISAERSLAFASRSLTLALAIPATDSLGGDPYTVAAVAITSGIFGALFGQKILALFRIPEDDYVTRGVTLGANSSAIATAMLLRSDPRAAALSSLSLSIFGTITVLFAAIPIIANTVRFTVGLPAL